MMQPPKAQPARKRSGIQDGLPRLALESGSEEPTEGVQLAETRSQLDLSGFRTEGRQAGACRLFLWKLKPMPQQTPLNSAHRQLNARMVDFGGWDMPLHYGSQIDEHHSVRQSAGVFDVSHMTVVDVRGPAATAFLRSTLANDVSKLSADGRGLYSCMLNEAGGVIDDLIVYRLSPEDFRLIVNAATRQKDLAWLQSAAQGCDVTLTERRDGIMLAVQGPDAVSLLPAQLPSPLRDSVTGLKPFHCCGDSDVFVARTGYTGEDGFECVIADSDAGQALWSALVEAGASPCGLGARDTLRLEAGLSLYGQDLDEEHSPLTSGLAWTVAWDPAGRQFTGRPALERERDTGPAERMVGLLLEDRGIMRHGQTVHCGEATGVVTSGGFSPTLQRSIGMARVPASAGEHCEVEIRRRRCRARIVPPVFVRRGEVKLDLGAAS